MMTSLLKTFVLACFLPLPALAGTLIVQGTGRVEIAPDQASVQISIEHQAKTAPEAMRLNSKAANEALAEIEKAGILRRDIRTAQLNLQPVYSQTSERAPKIEAYRAVHSLQLTLRDLDKLGDLLDSLTRNGANRIEAISFSSSQEDSKRDEARLNAFRDAKRKADMLGKEGGFTLEAIQELSEEGLSVRPFASDFRAQDVRASSIPVPAMPGTQSVETTLRVIWKIAP